MADYSHHHTYRVARAPHGASARRFGWVLAVAAILMLATLGWVWVQQRSVDSPLPRATMATSQAVTAPAPVMAKPAPVADTAAPAASAPPSDVVAAAGDTRAVH